MKAFFNGRTDTGRYRDHNEDAFQLVPALGIAVLADGMGGHNAGEVASELAISPISATANVDFIVFVFLMLTA